MKRKIILTIIAMSLASCGSPQASQQLKEDFVEASTGTFYETVTHVKDGDTVEIDAKWNPYPALKWSVRVRGIDTPEKGRLAKCEREKQLSVQAQALTTKLLKDAGQRVRLRDVGHDKYGGRFDAEIILSDGRSLGEELIKANLAKRYNGNGPKPNWCY